MSLALLIAPSPAPAQEGAQQQLWLDFNPSVTVAPGVAVFGDVGIRVPLETSADWRTMIIRPGTMLSVGGVRLAAGGAGFYTADPGADKWELRPWQGIGITWPRSLGLEHYVRTEQRASISTDTWDTRWSLRTRYNVQIPISLADRTRGHAWRLLIGSEGFLTFNPDPGQRHRQLRCTMAAEHTIDPTWRVRLEITVELARRYHVDGGWTGLYLRLRTYLRS